MSVWRFICQSVQVAHHRADGSDCQDSNSVRYLGEGEHGALVACVADGAGSSTHSGIGSRMACEAIVESATAHLKQHGTLSNVEASDVLAWCEAAALRELPRFHRERGSYYVS